jgi:hypothetical protein
MRNCVPAGAASLLALAAANAMFGRNMAGSHTVRISGPLTNLQEALVIGNGDLAALVTVLHHEIVFLWGTPKTGQ